MAIRRGRFIALEGGEGAGKSTQARLLAAALEERGLSVVLTREPGGTPGAEAIRDLLLHPPGQGWGVRSEALLFAAARADHVERLVRPALARGDWVVCDRFVDSSRAYQGGAGGIGDEAVLRLHAIGSEGLRPDLTVLVEIAPEVAARRLRSRDAATSDAIGSRSVDYHAQVAASFRDLAEAGGSQCAVVDGAGTERVVHARLMRAVEHLLAPPS